MENIENKIDIIEDNTSYNYYLYQKRLELNMKKRHFAKLFKMSYLKYHLIERGYLKPSKKDVEKISNYFGIDYNYYLQDERSYPTEIEDKKYLKITLFLYHMFTKKAVKIVLGVFTSLFLLTFTTTQIVSAILENNEKAFQNQYVIDFDDKLEAEGEKNFSLWNYNYPQITEVSDIGDNNQKAVIVSGVYNKLSFSFKEIYWIDDYRFTINFSSLNGDTIDYTVMSINYQDYSIDFFFISETNGVNTLEYFDEGNEVYTAAKKIIDNYVISNDINDLVKSKLGMDFDLITFQNSLNEGRERTDGISRINAIFFLISLIFSAIFVFLFAYALIYQKGKDEKYQFEHSDVLLGFNPRNEKIRKDIRFFPFIPEIVLKIIGILLVVIGATRLMIYSDTIIEYSSESMATANQFLSIQMLGMFFIFFINFDIFMDDIRLFRNILLYTILFMLIFYLEASIIQSFVASESIFNIIVQTFSLPNPFGSAAWYFLIMFFLFFTPKNITTKKRLIIFRTMAILPIAMIIISFIIGHIDVLFNVTLDNYWIKYFFKEDRLPLSLLAISYLVLLFFLRLIFKIKYGEERAKRYFNGNKFLFMKNLLAVFLIVVIWIIEMHFRNNLQLNKIGIGVNVYLIILAPLVLFYHPHKGARNTKSDVTLIIIYGISLTLIYTLVALMTLRSILYSLAGSLI